MASARFLRCTSLPPCVRDQAGFDVGRPRVDAEAVCFVGGMPSGIDAPTGPRRPGGERPPTPYPIPFLPERLLPT